MAYVVGGTFDVPTRAQVLSQKIVKSIESALPTITSLYLSKKSGKLIPSAQLTEYNIPNTATQESSTQKWIMPAVIGLAIAGGLYVMSKKHSVFGDISYKSRKMWLPVVYGYAPEGGERPGEVLIDIPKGYTRAQLRRAAVHGPSSRMDADMGVGFRLLFKAKKGGYYFDKLVSINKISDIPISNE